MTLNQTASQAFAAHAANYSAGDPGEIPIPEHRTLLQKRIIYGLHSRSSSLDYIWMQTCHLQIGMEGNLEGTPGKREHGLDTGGPFVESADAARITVSVAAHRDDVRHYEWAMQQ